MKTKYYTCLSRLCNNMLHNLVLLCMIVSLIMSLCCTNVLGDVTVTETSSETWPTAPEIFAQAGIVIDASTGTVLYNKNICIDSYVLSVILNRKYFYCYVLGYKFNFLHDSIVSCFIKKTNKR